MIELRMHGRGGQGTVLAAEILASAMVAEGTSASCFPFFGQERRGAPVQAYVRYGEQQVRERSRIYNPNIVLILDTMLAANPVCYKGILPGGMVIANAPLQKMENVIPPEVSTVVTLNATEIALGETGKAITNTAMLGCFAGATGAVSVASLKKVLEDYFNGQVLLRNANCVQRGYDGICVYKRTSDGVFLPEKEEQHGA